MLGTTPSDPDDGTGRAAEARAALRAEAERLASDEADRAEAARVLRDMADLRLGDREPRRP
jgi:hypothetical protein